jgi:hypothetical protein
MRLFRKIGSLFGWANANPTKRPRATAIEHPILGSLVPHKLMPESLSGRLKYGQYQVDLVVSPDDSTIEVALELATSLIERLEALDLKCRRLIAEEFLESYNSHWRFGEVAHQDGTFKAFEKPHLTTAQFCENLKISSIQASGCSLLVFYYDDSDMFWGHTLEAISFDGIAFEDTHVSMAG